MKPCAINIRGFIKKQWKQSALLFALLIVLCACLIHQIWQPYPTFVYGKVSPKDVSEIKSVLHRRLRATLFPKLSWTNVMSLPGSVRIYAGQHVQSISSQTDGTATANVRIRSSGKYPQVEICNLVRTTNGWQVTGSQVVVR